MKYFFQSMLGAMLLLSGVFAFSSCGNDESDPDSTVTIAMATVENNLSMMLLIWCWTTERSCGWCSILFLTGI